MAKKESSERIELLMRILIGIVSGIILYLWMYLVGAVILVHFVFVLFSGNRNKDLADFVEYFNTEAYKYFRYLSFNSNKRPFPFSSIEKMNKFEK